MGMLAVHAIEAAQKTDDSPPHFVPIGITVVCSIAPMHWNTFNLVVFLQNINVLIQYGPGLMK